VRPGGAHAERLKHVALRALEQRMVQLGGQVVGLQVERHALRTATPRTERRVVGRRDAMQPLKSCAALYRVVTTIVHSENYSSYSKRAEG
jgi:hypothetical protein